MINELIEKQLDKLKVATKPEYDSINHQFVFKKKEGLKLEVGNSYFLVLNNLLLNEHDNEILVYNFNKGTYPKCKYMKVAVLHSTGNMINVQGVYCNEQGEPNGTGMWAGWLPIDQVEVKNV